jgi:hypothetical protein
MAIMHEPIDDPQLVAAANVFVDDIIETAKAEAAQRITVNTTYKYYIYEYPT